MNAHLSEETIQQWADGEIAGDAAVEAHLHQCVVCSNAALAAVRMKGAVREVFPRGTAPGALRERVSGMVRDEVTGDASLRSAAPRLRRLGMTEWLAAAAVLAAIAIALGAVVQVRSRSTMRELADLHNTNLASASPVDVVSTDRHTVKPWFEGRVPFAVPVAELEGTPFHLIGGRVVYLHGAPGACLIIGKKAHRLTLFVFRAGDVPLRTATPAELTMLAWESNGLAFVAVGDVPRSDLESLRTAWSR